MKVAGISDVIFTDSVDFYVSGAGNDTTGDGSSGTPWLTLQKAFDYISYLRLAYPADIQINIADGHYSWTGPILATTPWGARIRVMGTTVIEKTMTSVQSSSGSAGAYSVIVNLNSVANIIVNDLAIFHTCSGGTNPERMVGAFLVSNVDAVNTRITVTSTNLIGVPSGNVAATVEVLKTVITFPGSGIYAIPAMKVDKLGLVGPGSTGNGLYCTMQSRMTLAETSFVGVTGFAGGVSMDSGSSCVVSSGAGRLSISGCTTGVNLVMMAGFSAGGGIQVTGCATGVYAAGRSMANVINSKIHGNTLGMYALQGGYINGTGADTTGNGTAVSPTANTEGNDHAYLET